MREVSVSLWMPPPPLAVAAATVVVVVAVVFQEFDARPTPVDAPGTKTTTPRTTWEGAPPAATAG